MGVSSGAAAVPLCDAETDVVGASGVDTLGTRAPSVVGTALESTFVAVDVGRLAEASGPASLGVIVAESHAATSHSACSARVRVDKALESRALGTEECGPDMGLSENEGRRVKATRGATKFNQCVHGHVA